MTEEVITIAPSGQIVTFKDLTFARVILLKKYHSRIIVDAFDLSRRMSLERLRNLMLKSLRLEIQDSTTKSLLAITDKVKLAQELWPMLVASGRRTADVAFNRNVKQATLPTHTTYFCDYEPGTDSARDLSYIKLTPQARVLVDMFVEKIKPAGKFGVPEYLVQKYVQELKDSGELVTKQDAWRIFYYYRSQLIARGFIDVREVSK